MCNYKLLDLIYCAYFDKKNNLLFSLEHKIDSKIVDEYKEVIFLKNIKTFKIPSGNYHLWILPQTTIMTISSGTLFVSLS